MMIVAMEHCSAASYSAPMREIFLGYEDNNDAVERNLVSLFIKNIPDIIRDKEVLKAHFCQFGKVSSIFINERHHGTINFYTHDAARNALTCGKVLNGYYLHLGWSTSDKSKELAYKHMTMHRIKRAEAYQRKQRRLSLMELKKEYQLEYEKDMMREDYKPSSLSHAFAETLNSSFADTSSDFVSLAREFVDPEDRSNEVVFLDLEESEKYLSKEELSDLCYAGQEDCSYFYNDDERSSSVSKDLNKKKESAWKIPSNSNQAITALI